MGQIQIQFRVLQPRRARSSLTGYLGPAGQLPAPASTCPRSDREPGHEAGQNGHHDQARTERVPDSDILAWLRHQADTTGQVPGRRQMIEKWALGSTRAERLRAIIIREAGNKTPAPAG
jgi:hypothetical protein